MKSRKKRRTAITCCLLLLILGTVFGVKLAAEHRKPIAKPESTVSSEPISSVPVSRAPISSAASAESRAAVSSVNSAESETAHSSPTASTASAVSQPTSAVPSALPVSSAAPSSAVSSSSATVSVAPRKVSALVYNAATQQILFEEDSHAKHAPASLTKLLTALVALRYASPETVCTVGRELEYVQPNSSLAIIAQGQKLTLEQLLYGLLLASGNDAAYTIAANVGKIIQPNAGVQEAVAAFVAAMNDYCTTLGMADSHFANPDGWDDDRQYTTAADLRLLACAAMENTLLKNTVQTKSKSVTFVSGQQITWTNSNKLLNAQSAYYNAACIGVKTGTTGSAGQCLISAFQNDTGTYYVIVLDCESDDRRYHYSNELYQTYCKAP